MLHRAEHVVRVQRLIGRAHAENRNVGGLRRIDDLIAVLPCDGGIDAVQPDFLARCRHRQQLAVVLQQHHRAALRIECLGLEVGVSDDLAGRVRIDIRMVEQALLEFLQQDAIGRLRQAVFRQLPAVDGVDEVARIVVSAELVDAGVDRPRETLHAGRAFHPQGMPSPTNDGDPDDTPLMQFASQSSAISQSDRITPLKPYFPRSRSVSNALS